MSILKTIFNFFFKLGQNRLTLLLINDILIKQQQQTTEIQDDKQNLQVFELQQKKSDYY
jgi:hypothetical protein